MLKKLSNNYSIIIVFALPFIIFLTNIDGGWVLDDHSHIENNQNIQSIRHIKKILTSTVGEITPVKEQRSHIYRPVVLLSWLFNYHIFGMKPWGFHLVSNIIHCINVVLLFLLARSFFSLNISLFTALLFGLHPMVIEGTTWMAGRQDPLVALFALINTFCLVKLAKTKQSYKNSLFIIFLLTIPLGLFSKETFLLIPFANIAILYITKEKEESWQYLFYCLAGCFLLTGLCWVWRDRIVGSPDFFHLTGYSFTNFKALVERFLFLFLVPSDSDFINTYSFKPSGHLHLFIFFLILPAVTTGTYFMSKRKRALLIGLSLSMLSMLPVSLVIHITGFLSERYFYLPLAGLTLVLAACYSGLTSRIKDYEKLKVRKSVKWFAIAWLAMLALSTVSRNREWKNERTLYSSSLKRNPDNHMAHYFMAWHHARNNNRIEELNSYFKVLKTAPSHLPTINNIAVRMIEAREFDGALYFLKKALKINPKRPKTHYNFGYYYEMTGDLDKSLEWYKSALKLHPGYTKAKEAIRRVNP